MLSLLTANPIGEQLFMSSVFIAGFLSFFAPCTFPMLPVYIGLLTSVDTGKLKSNGEKTIQLAPIVKTLLFVAGLSTTFMTLGFGFGVLGSFINSSLFSILSGTLVIALGVHQMGIFQLPGLSKYRVLNIKKSREADFLGAYVLGLTFSFAWTPCVGPVLGAVLVVSADGGQAFYGAFLMGLYAIGLMIPFLIMAVFSTVLLEKVQKLEAHLDTIKKVGGFLIVLMGILLITNQLNVITAWMDKLL